MGVGSRFGGRVRYEVLLGFPAIEARAKGWGEVCGELKVDNGHDAIWMREQSRLVQNDAMVVERSRAAWLALV